MGVFQRQGLKYSVVNWFGIFISALSTVFVFPYALEEYGIIRFVLDTSLLAFPLVSLGMSYVCLRFFPYFKDQDTQNHGFLGLVLLWAIAGCLFFCALAFCFREPLLARYGSKNPLFERYLWLILPAVFLTTVNTLFLRYSINYNRVVIPSLLVDVMPKLVLPLLVIAYLKRWISLDAVMYGVLVYLLGAAVSFVFYIIHLKAWNIRPDFGFITPELRKEMYSYAIYGLVSGFLLILISKLDSWLVSSLLDLKKGGVYSISSFIANVIEVPSRALVSIGAPLVSQYWMENNMAEMKKLYQKVSINLLIVGLALFGAFWVSVDAFFEIVANGSEMQQGKFVILFLGMARLIDMATGLNNHLLINSSKFRYSYLQIIAPAIISIGLGYYLTIQFGMIGAAIANLIAVAAYNFLSIGINWYFFKLQPFSRQTLNVMGLGLLAYAITVSLPLPDGHSLIRIGLRSGLFLLLFVCPVLYYRLSDDLNAMLAKFLPKLK